MKSPFLFFPYFGLYTTDSAISSAVSPRSCPIRLSAKSTAVPRPRLVLDDNAVAKNALLLFNPSMQDGYADHSASRNPSVANTVGAAQMAATFLPCLLNLVGDHRAADILRDILYPACHPGSQGRISHIRKIGFFKSKVCLHMDSVRSGDVSDLLNGNCLYIDLCAAHQINYSQSFNVFKSVCQKNIYFLLIKSSSLMIYWLCCLPVVLLPFCHSV